MATQTSSTETFPVRIPVRFVRTLLVRLIARRRALRILASIGVTGRHARLLAREMADRARS